MINEERLLTKDLHYSYDKTPCINGISSCFRRNELTSILGPNGSGKSTYIKLLAGILRPQRGSVTLDGRELSLYTPKELARKMSYVSQNSGIDFGFSVRDVVMMGRTPYSSVFRGTAPVDYQAVNEAIVKANIEHIVGRPINELSGGEYKKVMIARALAQKADIMLLDEPVSGLDIRHQADIMKILRLEAQNGTTVIAVQHDLNIAASFSDRILLIKSGEIYSQGSPSEVLTPVNIEDVYRQRVSVFSEAGKLHIMQIYQQEVD